MKAPSLKRYCQHCGERFMARRKSAEYCSPNCRWNAWYERDKASKPKVNSALKRWESKNKVISLRYCQNPKCHKSFFVTGNNSRKMYCNHACCQSAYRQRFELKRQADVQRRILAYQNANQMQQFVTYQEAAR